MTKQSFAKSNNINAQSAFVCGEAFQKSAEFLIPKIIPKKLKVDEQPTHDMSNKMGDVVVCATNLSFAIELYIKALLSHQELQVPKSHDLILLYNTIPQEIRAIIEEVYKSAIMEDQSKLPGNSWTLAKGAQEAPEWNDRKKDFPYIPDLLERSKDLFQSWRYVCEVNISNGESYQFHKFEYGLLRFAAEAIRVEVVVRLSGMDEIQTTS